jgi:hypothetical protein
MAATTPGSPSTAAAPQQTEKQKRSRSPAYPSDGLETCMRWARRIYEAEKRSATSTTLAAKHMGYSSLSGPVRTGLSAMKKFGLLIEDGSERVRITDDAYKLFLTPDEGVRLSILRSMAQKPEIIRELLVEHKDGLPSDDSLRFKLVTERGFGEEAAGTLIKALHETVRVAKLDPGEYNPGEMEQAAPKDAPSGPPPAWQAAGTPAGNGAPKGGHGSPTPPLAGAALHVWSLGNGVTVELRANQPLQAKHFKRLSKYVELAAEAEEDDKEEGA